MFAVAEDQGKLQTAITALTEDIWAYSEELYADSMRCNHRVVGKGTSQYEVLLHCGESAAQLLAQATRSTNDLVRAIIASHRTVSPLLLSQGILSAGYTLSAWKLKAQYGVDAMGETAENVAEERRVSRDEQDRFACRSQERAAAARTARRFEREITPVAIPQRKGDPRIVAEDEYIRPGTTPEVLAKLKPAFRAGGSVTAGNASGINDGAAALLVGSEAMAGRLGATPLARFVTSAVAGVEPRTMGMGPVPASRLALSRAGLTLADMSVIELNEAFAAQALACMRELGIDDDDPRVNPNGGAIALGHPLGMSGARLLLTAAHQLRETGGRYALATMCVGVGQGMAAIIERA